MITIRTKQQQFNYDVASHEHLVFLTVGLAMARVQAFESLVATILCSISEPTKQPITIESIDEEISKFDSQTLGRLINMMKKRVAGEELHRKLLSVKDGRNFIAHWSLRNYSDLNEEQAIHLAVKIETIMDEIEEVQSLLISELSNQDVTHISEIYIDEDSGKIEDVNSG